MSVHKHTMKGQDVGMTEVSKNLDFKLKNTKLDLNQCYIQQYRNFKPRIHEQFLCDKFYLFASECPIYTSTFI